MYIPSGRKNHRWQNTISCWVFKNSIDFFNIVSREKVGDSEMNGRIRGWGMWCDVQV